MVNFHGVSQNLCLEVGGMRRGQTTALATENEKCEVTSLSHLTDDNLVSEIHNRTNNFLFIDLRPLMNEILVRFSAAKATGKPYFGHTDFNKFCPAVLNYSSKQVRNIAAGNPTGKTTEQKAIDAARRELNKKTKAAQFTLPIRKKTNEEILAAAEELQAAKTAEQKTQEYAEAYAAPKIAAAVKQALAEQTTKQEFAQDKPSQKAKQDAVALDDADAILKALVFAVTKSGTVTDKKAFKKIIAFAIAYLRSRGISIA